MKKMLDKINGFFKKEKRQGDGIFALVFALLLVFNITLTIIVESFGLYFYEKDKTDFAISGNTDHLFEEAIKDGKKIKISFCLDKFDEEGYLDHESGKPVHKTVLAFRDRYPELVEIDYINVLTRRNQDGKLVDLGKYQKDMRGEDTYVLKTSVIFECGDNYRVVTDAYSTAGFAGFYTLDANGTATSYNGEEVVAAMMSWVLKDEHKTAYFTKFHGEAPDIAFANLMVCAGYYIDEIDLKNEAIPSDAGIVVIANPKSDFERGAEGSGIVSEIERLRDYLDRGGNLMITLDPYAKRLAVLESFLKDYGIAFSATESESGASFRNMVRDVDGAITLDGFTLAVSYADVDVAKKIENKVSSFSDGGVIIREASALSLSGDAKPILVTSAASRLEANGEVVDTSGRYTVAAYSEKAVDGGASAKLFVVPSIYLAVSDSLVSQGYANKDFIYALLEECFGCEGLPYGCRDVLYNTETLENLTMKRARIYTAVIMTVPLCFTAAGLVVLTKRKHR